MGTSDDLVTESAKVLFEGNEQLEIVDRSDGVRFVDLVTEARYADGIVHLSFGCSIYEYDNPGIAEVSTRVRMSILGAQNLRALLDDCITEALQPVIEKRTGR
ncbi:hypothetical protein J2Y48_004774 [Mycoplana sp. BE70]|uniref:hypothetical protein n=1 Tax=Mycoplana sp. BE70 TaxID=2817775 RepID=UPI002862B87D|nr:hypothetical protein [Mycoplana sp. BE70]MDR6759458.1 hypothetical protein [Mycoplana sp. BE70]